MFCYLNFPQSFQKLLIENELSKFDYLWMTQDLRPGRLQSFQRTGAQLKKNLGLDKVDTQNAISFGIF